MTGPGPNPYLKNTWNSNIIEVKDVINYQLIKISNEKINEGLPHPEGRPTKLPNASEIRLLGFFFQISHQCLVSQSIHG